MSRTGGSPETEEFEALRPRMFGLAYRLLGSAHDAEDVVQDAFLRWQAADRAAVRSPWAWLAKVVTNLALNRLTSAPVRRERYVGQWLPEPVLTTTGVLGPLETAEQRESVSLALLVLLERLKPTERAVYVLREAFGYGHREVADVLGITEANSRQIHRRARASLEGATVASASEISDADRARWHDLVVRFMAAARAGDLGGLEQLLTADVTSWADGGGRVGTARRPVLGRDRVARYLVGGFTRFAAGVDVVFDEVNGVPAVLALVGGAVFGVLVPEFSGGRISALRIIANPDKLVFIARQSATVSHPAGSPGSHR
nr:RNA polymerase sigma-70 factor [Saccharopolyspora erythraea]